MSQAAIDATARPSTSAIASRSTLTPAPGLTPFSARRRRNARAPGTPKNAPTKCRVIECSRVPQHHAIDMRKVRLGRGEFADAAIDDDGQTGHRRFQPIDPVVIERRDV